MLKLYRAIRKNVVCWMFHKYDFLRLTYYIDTSYGGNIKSTQILTKCAYCKKIKEENKYGITLYDSDFR